MADFSFLHRIFTNYEITKLHINEPFLLNSLIYCTLVVVTLVTLKKKASIFFDFSQTEQIKGLSILFVIIDHFWYHVCNERGTALPLGSYAVTLFLLLSGYGLMSSKMANGINTRVFFMKRVKKIFIPYWLVTIGIIIADYVLWQRHYPLQDLLLTFAGINISTELQYFDHSRWFITLLLLNYLIFFFCVKYWSTPSATLILLFISLALILLTHYGLFFLGSRHQLLAFPLGCLLAFINPSKWWGTIGLRHLATSLIFIALATLSIYLCTLMPTNNFYIQKAIIYSYSYILPFMFCLLCIVFIALLASLGCTSSFLGLCGYLSFEMYLIHGPLLIKYNPIVGIFDDNFTLLRLMLWFGITLILSYLLKSSASFINNSCIKA